MQHRYIRSTLHIAVKIKSAVEEPNVLSQTFRHLVERVDGANTAQALATISHRLSHLQLHVVFIWAKPNVWHNVGAGPRPQDTCHLKGSDLGNENALGGDVGLVTLLAPGPLHMWNQSRIVHPLIPGSVDATQTHMWIGYDATGGIQAVNERRHLFVVPSQHLAAKIHPLLKHTIFNRILRPIELGGNHITQIAGSQRWQKLLRG